MNWDIILDALIFIMVFSMCLLVLEVDYLKEENASLRKKIRKYEREVKNLYG